MRRYDSARKVSQTVSRPVSPKMRQTTDIRESRGPGRSEIIGKRSQSCYPHRNLHIIVGGPKIMMTHIYQNSRPNFFLEGLMCVEASAADFWEIGQSGHFCKLPHLIILCTEGYSKTSRWTLRAVGEPVLWAHGQTDLMDVPELSLNIHEDRERRNPGQKSLL